MHPIPRTLNGFAYNTTHIYLLPIPDDQPLPLCLEKDTQKPLGLRTALPRIAQSALTGVRPD